MVDSQSQLRLKRIGPCSVEVRQSYPSYHMLNTECAHRVFSSNHPPAHSCRPAAQLEKHDSQHWPAFLLTFGLKQTEEDVRALHCKTRHFKVEDKPKDRLLHSVGQRGSRDGYFRFPRGLSVSAEGEIAVADTDNHRVQLFNGAGVFKNVIGRGEGAAPGELLRPADVAWMPTGNYAVADTGNSRVQIFRPRGNLRMMFLTKAPPVAIVCDSAHNLILIDEGGQVEIYRKGGRFDKAFAVTSGGAAGSVVSLMSLSANGRLIAVSDTGSATVHLFDYAGSPLLRFQPAASRPGLAAVPVGIDLPAAADDLLLVADAANHTVNVYALTGDLQGQALGPTDDLGSVQAMRVTPEGHIVVTEFAANGLHCLKVFRFLPCQCHAERPTSAKRDKSTPIPKTHYTSDVVVPDQ